MATNSFNISNGRIVGPSGQQFIAKGINLFDNQIGASDEILSLFPGINMIRLAVENLSDTPATLLSFINQMTSAGIVVEIEDHTTDTITGTNNIPSGSALTTELSWYSSMAAAYANNPYVWFGTMNEPYDPSNDAAVTSQEVSIYNTIRAAGDANPIMLEQIGGYTSTGLAPGSYASMTNVVWDTHYYGWVSNYSTDQAVVSNDLAAQIRNAQSITTAEGIVPVIVGEYGLSATGTNVDANANQVLSAVQGSGYGSLAWAFCSGSIDQLVNGGADIGGTLTTYGQAIAKFIATSTSTGTGTIPAASMPVTTGIGSDKLVLSISEDAYANGDGTSDVNGDAAFTVSVDGKQLAGTFYATGSHSAGASQNFTFNGNWAPGTHTVTVAFLNDAWGGTGSTDRNLYVNDVTYDGTDTMQSAALMSTGSQTFSVTDSTAIPPVVTGGGSDSLVVKVSEDYYLANAQFTVSIDGKQLGGTFTATTLHSSGNSQTFAFAGDFGSGQHTVSVDFLNDAWAGTPATDRNLYVNDIVYNGTDTAQSAPLYTNGAKTFSVSGGTTPSVSETGDHGSLQKNLSQTGTYTVGGDTFVLGSGNAATVTLGTGTSQIKFVGPSAVTLTGGAGQATVTADAGNNKFVAGTGSLDVTGGAGKDAYVFHTASGLLTLEDFSLAKGDTLTVDKSLQGSLQEASDGTGGTMLTFGANANHGVDIHGVAALPSSNIAWA